MLFTISGPYRLPRAWPRPSWASSFLPIVITLPASVRQTVCFVLMATSTIRARIEWMRVGTKAVLTWKINKGLAYNDVTLKSRVRTKVVKIGKIVLGLNLIILLEFYLTWSHPCCKSGTIQPESVFIILATGILIFLLLLLYYKHYLTTSLIII